MVTRIDLLRHGEPVGGRRYRGQIDDPLSERGWEQMWGAIQDRGPWQQIVTSPLVRCSAFAHALAEQANIPIREDDRLMEVGFGAWEGKTPDQLRSEDADQLRRFFHDPVSARPVDAEPLQAFLERVQQGFHEILSESKDKSVLIVAHAGVIRGVVVQVLKMPMDAMYRVSVPSAGMVRVQIDGDRPPTLVFP